MYNRYCVSLVFSFKLVKHEGNKSLDSHFLVPSSADIYTFVHISSSFLSPDRKIFSEPPTLGRPSVRGIWTVPSGKRSAVKTFLVSHQSITFTQYKVPPTLRKALHPNQTHLQPWLQSKVEPVTAGSQAQGALLCNNHQRLSNHKAIKR